MAVLVARLGAMENGMTTELRFRRHGTVQIVPCSAAFPTHKCQIVSAQRFPCLRVPIYDVVHSGRGYPVSYVTPSRSVVNSL